MLDLFGVERMGIMDILDSVHDVLYDIRHIDPSNETVKMVIERLPNDILEVGKRWGYFDTEFREMVYIWAKENVEIEDGLFNIKEDCKI